MSLLDVFSGRQSFGSWLTGRDPKESDVYANYDKVSVVTEDIRNIGTTTVGNAQDAIYEAFNQLNSVNGLAQYVGTVNVGEYDSVFTSVSDTIVGIADALEGKAEDIKIYEESGFLEKVGSTALMGVCKLGEGLLSVVEDLGDGVLSIVGWGAGKLGLDGVQEFTSNAIKSEWSHDTFNWYYDSDFAKKSAFTEDSAIAGGLKIVGKTAGYLYAGGFMAGATGLSTASAAIKAGGTAGKVATGLLKVASSSTWGATMAAGLGGFGSGTESGLNAGLSFDEATGVGVKSAVVQAGLAFAGGKIGEKVAKSAAVKDAKANGGDVAAVKATKLRDYQGYTDKFTQAGERFGTATRDTVKTGLHAAKATITKSADAATARADFKDSAKQLAHENPVAQGWRETGGKAINAAKQTAANVKANGVVQTAKDGIKGAAHNAASSVRQTASNIASRGVVGNVQAAAGAVAKATPYALEAANAAAAETVQQSGIQAKAQIESAAAIPQNVPNAITTTGAAIPTGSPSAIPTTGGQQQQTPPTNGGQQTPPTTGGGGGRDTGGGGGTQQQPTVPTTPITVPETVPQQPTQPITQPQTVPQQPTQPITVPQTVPQQTAQPITVPQTVPQQPTQPVGTPSGPGSGGEQYHTGVGYGDGYGDGTGMEASLGGALEDLLDDSATSIDEIIKGSKYSRIPTSSKPITASGSGSSSVIPIAAGLSAASAAGLGAKAYIDHKRAKEEEEEDEFGEDDEFDAEGWVDGEDPNALAIEGEEEDSDEFVNKDKLGDDEYYHASEGAFTITGRREELEEV